MSKISFFFVFVALIGVVFADELQCISVIDGNDQSTTVDQPFTNPLTVQLCSNPGCSSDDCTAVSAAVVFMAPGSGASCTLGSQLPLGSPSGSTIIVSATANDITGPYDVVVSPSGKKKSGPSATFSLTNTPEGGGGGDPLFNGFLGQRYHFRGQPDKTFHLFSDPSVLINSRFAVANPASGKGTVMAAFGILWVNHSVTFDVHSVIDRKLLSLVVDGVTMQFARSKTGAVLFAADPCPVHLHWANPHLSLEWAGLYKMQFTWVTSHTSHVNTTLFKVTFDVPLEDPTQYGGLIGQTATKNSTLSTRTADFVSTDLLSNDSKTSKFAARTFACHVPNLKATAKATVDHV